VPVHVDDLVLYLQIVYSRRFIDQFESQITSQIKLLRASNAPGFDKKMWSREARQSLRYAFFLRYYASFESHLKVICERCAQEESLPLRLSDISGENFLNKANKYLTRLAKREPLNNHSLWDDVLAYSWIRNAIIHNDGRVFDQSSIPQYVVRQLRRSHPGSSPETWVTQRTDHIGNTFGPNGFSSGSNTRVSRSKYPRS